MPVLRSTERIPLLPDCHSAAVPLILTSMTRSWSFLVAVVLFCAVPFFAEENPANPKAGRIARLVSTYEKYGYFNGAILVAESGQVIYERGVGEANMDLHTPNTPQTRFDIGSITKQFTAALVLLQAANGKLRLDATVSQMLPWYRTDTGSRMTIEQLLLHTSGLPPDFNAPEFGDGEATARYADPVPFAERVCQPSLVAEPGTQWNYSNCGYILLGLILERVTGKPYDVLLQTQLLLPLQMNDSGIDRNNLPGLSGATGYTRHAGPRYLPGPVLDRTHLFSAGAMYSTVEDLYRWNQALSSGKLLSEDLRAKIFTPGLGDWSCGWFITKIPAGTPGEGSTMAETRGDMPGNFFAWILHYPEQDAAIIVLRNGYGSSERLEQNLQAILFDQEPHPPRRSVGDVAAHFGWLAWDWIASNRLATGLILILLGLLLVRNARNRVSFDSR